MGKSELQEELLDGVFAEEKIKTKNENAKSLTRVANSHARTPGML